MKRFGISLLFLLSVLAALSYQQTDYACTGNACGECRRFKYEGSSTQYVVCTKCTIGGGNKKSIRTTEISSTNTLGSQSCGLGVGGLIGIILGIIAAIIIISIICCCCKKKTVQPNTMVIVQGQPGQQQYGQPQYGQPQQFGQPQPFGQPQYGQQPYQPQIQPMQGGQPSNALPPGF